MNKALDGAFKIKFENGTIFTGNLFNKDWCKCSNISPIKRIDFKYGGKQIGLEDFQEYNLTMEIHAELQKKSKIANIVLAGRTKGESFLFIYDFTSGKLLQKRTPKWQEYGNLKGTTWKLGVTGKPQMYIKPILHDLDEAWGDIDELLKEVPLEND